LGGYGVFEGGEFGFLILICINNLTSLEVDFLNIQE
jgi:hypothetical protein